MRVLGLVLAGGSARRLNGRPKHSLELLGQTLLDRAIANLAPQTEGLALSINIDRRSLPPGDFTVLSDGAWAGSGPLAGIRAGLAWAARSGFGAVLSLPVDCPFAPSDLRARLQLALPAGHGPALAMSPPLPGADPLLHPAIGLWPVGLLVPLESALAAGTRKVTDWTAPLSPGTVAFAETSGDPFFNINRPEDLGPAAEIAGQR
jgi:molybdopterin-guanine dinucleotide biosynthesis protein A